jgi:uncharacterized protein YcbK (DUF882 family)
MVQTYSLAKCGGDYKLSPHFTLAEFACKDGSDLVMVSEELVSVLETLRSWVRLRLFKDAVVIITSGYRTPEHNRKQKGAAKGSQHCLGVAADIKVQYTANGEKKFVEPSVLFRALDTGRVTGTPFVGGLGKYPTWLHIDTRGTVARWSVK